MFTIENFTSYILLNFIDMFPFFYGVPVRDRTIASIIIRLYTLNQISIIKNIMFLHRWEDFSTPTKPVDNVVITIKGLQDRNTNILDGRTVENKGKLILYL